MSKATKRKHVTREVLNDFVIPEGNQEIVKVTASRGNNLHEVETAEQQKYLVSMPTKFRKNVWIKRGDFVIVEPIEEGDRVKAEIVSILYKDQIKYIQKEGFWPSSFEDKSAENRCEMIPSSMLPPSDGSDDDLADLVVNTNRPHIVCDSESSNTDSEEEGKEEEGDR